MMPPSHLFYLIPIVDALLVGDSLGVVIKGQASTREVKMSEVLYHTESVRRGSTANANH